MTESEAAQKLARAKSIAQEVLEGWPVDLGSPAPELEHAIRLLGVAEDELNAEVLRG